MWVGISKSGLCTWKKAFKGYNQNKTLKHINQMYGYYFVDQCLSKKLVNWQVLKVHYKYKTNL